MKERNVNFIETYYTCKFEICVSNYDVAKAWQFSPWKIILLDYSSWKKGMSSLWKHITLILCKLEICVLNCDLIKALIFSQFMKREMSSFWKHITLKPCKFDNCVSNNDLVKAWKFSPWKIIILYNSSWKEKCQVCENTLHLNNANGRYLFQIMI